MDFDRTSRHELVARMLREALPDGSRVLDVGGSEGFLKELLPEFAVEVTDIAPRDDVDFVADAADLPFHDRTFTAVTALDLLEHIPASKRASTIAELCRVSDGIVVLAGPYDSDGVRSAEDLLRAFFTGLFDQPHPWLTEHADHGLPSLGETLEALDAGGFPHVTTVGSNPVSIWTALQAANFLGARVGTDGLLDELHERLLQEFLDVGDAAPPSYRHILVASRQVVTFESAPSSDIDPTRLGPWADRIAFVAGAVVDRAMKRLAEGQSSLEEALDTARTEWARSVEHATALDDALDTARTEWARSVEHATALEQIAADREAALAAALESRNQRIARLETLADSLEARMISDPGAWRTVVSGPPVTVEAPVGMNPVDRYQSWIARRATSWEPVEGGPRISVLVPVFNPKASFLESCIRSVRSQTHENWELILYNASTEPHAGAICDRFASLDPRVRHESGANRGIAENTNRAAEGAAGTWLVLLDHDDELAPDALAAVASTVANDPEIDFVYTDEDKIDASGNRSDPFFKPDWSPHLLRTVNYITHLSAIRAELWRELGGMRAEYDGAQDYDLILRATHAARKVAHIPDVLYHWRTHDLSTASDVAVKPYAHRAGRRAVQDFVERVDAEAWVELGAGPTNHRVRYPVSPSTVSIIVPFRDRADLTERCLEGIAKNRSHLDFEVLAVSNRSEEPETHARIREWERRWAWFRCVDYDAPFNFQRMNNWAVRQTSGDLVLLLNNDAEALHAGWIDALAEYAQQGDVGAVSGRLFYPNGLVQHAGVTIGIGGFADHPWARLHPEAWTPFGPSYWVRDFVAVTAACLMVERRKFEEVDGFDERFTIGGGDVDLCIRLTEAGYRSVMTPFARLVHHESLTRGTSVPESDLVESKRSYAPYLEAGDPSYNPNLTLLGTDCQIAT